MKASKFLRKHATKIDDDDMIISIERWKEALHYIDKLEERSDWLTCLEYAGVDNWEGHHYAYEVQEEHFPERVENI